jgi:hypothetical protein
MAGTDEPESVSSWWEAALAALLLAPIITPIVFIVSLPALLYKAWVITKLWKWFVVPVFNLSPLPFGYACGLLLIFYLARSGDPQKREYSSREEEILSAFIGPIIGPTLSLAAGWFVKVMLCP